MNVIRVLASVGAFMAWQARASTGAPPDRSNAAWWYGQAAERMDVLTTGRLECARNVWILRPIAGYDGAMKHLFLPAAIWLSPCALADMLVVPDEHPTLADAIELAQDGDEVVLMPGYYTGRGFIDLDLQGKAITIRSYGGPVVTIIDAQFQSRVFRLQSGETPQTKIVGLFIIHGDAEAGDPEDPDGGAVLCIGASPTIDSCIFALNHAANGGAVDCSLDSYPTFLGCQFLRNSAREYGGALRSAIYCDPRFERCTFRGNTAPLGGAVAASFSGPLLSECEFTGNRAQPTEQYPNAYGGALYLARANTHTLQHARIDRCAFESNEADDVGGAIYIHKTGPRITSCLFRANAAGYAGGAAFATVFSVMELRDSTLVGNSAGVAAGAVNATHQLGVIQHSIVWGNRTETGIEPQIGGTYVYGLSPMPVRYSDVEGGHPGPGNIDAEPRFVLVIPGLFADSRLSADSPCIDAGDPEYPGDPHQGQEPIGFDLDGHSRIHGAAIDMGAYEFHGACELDCP